MNDKTTKSSPRPDFLCTAMDSCCDMYEQCRYVCGTSQEYCVEKFGECAARGCQRVVDDAESYGHDPVIMKRSCQYVAQKATDIYKLDSCESFTVVQKRSCQCHPKHLERTHRHDLVTSFLTQRNVTAAEVKREAMTVMRDVHDVRSWNDMMMRLFLKHPDSRRERRRRRRRRQTGKTSLEDTMLSTRPLREYMKSLLQSHKDDEIMYADMKGILKGMGLVDDEL